MTAASSSAAPSRVKAAPRPALNSGSFSRMRTAVVTASRLAPPRLQHLIPGIQGQLQGRPELFVPLGGERLCRNRTGSAVDGQGMHGVVSLRASREHFRGIRAAREPPTVYQKEIVPGLWVSRVVHCRYDRSLTILGLIGHGTADTPAPGGQSRRDRDSSHARGQRAGPGDGGDLLAGGSLLAASDQVG